ncbi:acyl-CoA dehydrogenase family protein [Streptomyces sp. NPDC001889]
MDFMLNEFERHLTKAVVTALHQDGDAWDRLAAIDAHVVGLPHPVDGLDLGLAAEAIVARELGRALEPLPRLRDAVLASHVLARCADARSAALLTDVVAGARRVGCAGPLEPDTSVTVDSRDRVRGTSPRVAAAAWDLVLVRATRSGEDVLVLVEPDGEGVEAEPAAAGEHGGVRLRCGAAPGLVLPAGPDLGRLRAAERVRQAAFLLGVADAAVEAGRRHANRRRQFERRLIDFQTVGHRLAALTGEADGLALLLFEAAWRLDSGAAPGPYPAQVLAASAELALGAARLAIQLHGARGMLAHDHPARAYRLAGAEAVRYGTPARLWREVAAARLAGVRDGTARPSGR